MRLIKFEETLSVCLFALYFLWIQFSFNNYIGLYYIIKEILGMEKGGRKHFDRWIYRLPLSNYVHFFLVNLCFLFCLSKATRRVGARFQIYLISKFEQRLYNYKCYIKMIERYLPLSLQTFFMLLKEYHLKAYN